MRPNQNKRMRGRNNNGGGNRKGPNPLSRTYESNGPDVKIRGTAHHIGEKYLQLARDAQSSGDPVMAESFLQHAEHYFRLIAAAQAAQQAASGFQRPPGEQPEAAEELEEEEDFAGGGMDRFASPVERSSGQPNHQPQPNAQPPYPERPYANGGNERPYQERGDRQEGRGQRHERHDRQDRPERHDRNFQDRNYQDRQQGGGRDDQRGRRQGRDYRQDNGGRFERSENRQAEEEPTKGLPAFITSPVRIQAESPPGNEQPESADLDQGEGDENFRQRRRRRRPDMGEGSTEITSATDPVSD